MVRWTAWLLAASVGIALLGCAYVQPDKEIETDPKPIKEGPGIFTGRSGAWVIIRDR